MPQDFFETPRLWLLPASAELAPMVLEYYKRNQTFFKPYESARGEAFFTLEHQCRFLAAEAERARMGTAFRFFLTLRERPEAGIIGLVALVNILMGPFCSAWLSYNLDEKQGGQGLMHEAVQKMIELAFTQFGLHRLEANIMPRNQRSLNIVKRFGFAEEGLAKQYLEIDGQWEDHLHMVLLNPTVPPFGGTQ